MTDKQNQIQINQLFNFRKLFDEESLNMTVNSVSNTARSSNSFTMFSQKKVDDYSTEMNF